jgi:hypothetical protein
MESPEQDNVNIVPFTPVSQLLPHSGWATDNSQPFPIYGWLKLHWHTPILTSTGAGSL